MSCPKDVSPHASNIFAEQKSAGVSDDQMQGIYNKKKMLELVTNNAEVINIIGKPILKKVLGFVKAI